MTDESPLAKTRMSVFPDTNVFLHFERLDNPKWLEVFPESPVLFVVVSTVVAQRMGATFTITQLLACECCNHRYP